MNKIIIKGRIGSNLELKSVGQKNTSLLNFSIADSYKSMDGGIPTNKTLWHSCTAWGKNAENINNFFSKGSNILVFGKIEENEYIDKKTNENKKSIKVIVESFEFLDSKSSDVQKNSYANSARVQEIEDNIPF